jgi:hypothetical protein
MTLSEKIAAGLATDAEVARFFGWMPTYIGAEMRDAWKAPNGGYSYQEPPFTTCLTTLAAECERREMAWCVGSNGGVCVSKCGDNYPAKSKDPALALCAALVAAVMEGKNDDAS